MQYAHYWRVQWIRASVGQSSTASMFCDPGLTLLTTPVKCRERPSFIGQKVRLEMDSSLWPPCLPSTWPQGWTTIPNIAFKSSYLEWCQFQGDDVIIREGDVIIQEGDVILVAVILQHSFFLLQWNSPKEMEAGEVSVLIAKQCSLSLVPRLSEILSHSFKNATRQSLEWKSWEWGQCCHV